MKHTQRLRSTRRRRPLARLETLEKRIMLDASELRISEFMAQDDSTLPDFEGEYPGWIEIHNPTDSDILLEGVHLTNDPGDLTKWKFSAPNPSTALASVNFTGRLSNNAQPDHLRLQAGASAGQIAGLNASDQWTDFATADGTYGAPAAVVGSSGDGTISIQLQHNGSWSHSASGARIVPIEDPDGDLTDGGWEVNTSADTLIAQGLADDFSGAYDVYLYFSSESLNNSASTWTLNGGSTQSISGLNVYDGNGLISGQDYLVWTDVSGDSVTLVGQTPSSAARHAVAGIEFVGTGGPMVLGPHEYQIVYASSKAGQDSGDEVHANFELDPAGQYLGLVDADGSTVIHDYSPSFPQQFTDISYGILPPQDDQFQYFNQPTPGAANVASSLEVISSTPRDGEVVFPAPTDVELNFSLPVLASSVSASDLTIDGQPAASFTMIDDITWRFNLASPLGAGVHTLVMPEGAVTSDPAGTSLAEFRASFTVPDTASVDNIEATQVEADSARVGAQVVSTGGQDPEITIYWGDNDAGVVAGDWDSSMTLGVGPAGDYFVSLLGLRPSTNYFHRANVANAAGGAWAATTASFATPNVTPPVVDNLPASSVSPFAARLNGRIVARGGETPVVTIYYGNDDAGEGIWDDSIVLGPQTGSFSGIVTGLTPETTYYFRAFAENSAGGAWSTPSEALVTLPTSAQNVVINEIHYDPDLKTEPVEFIELHNPTGVPVDISGWRINKAVDYSFPADTVIPENGYAVVAQDVAAFSAKFGVTPIGQWEEGDRLNNQGETIELLNQFDELIDKVDYQLGFPWPTVGGEGRSIELINPELDNTKGGNWRPAGADSELPPFPVTILGAAANGWSYRKGNSEASSPVDAWRQNGFVEDNSWSTGQTPIGYGDGDDNTVLDDMQGNYSSVYLRREFELTEIPPALQLRVLIDDGAIVYLNGVEVDRFYMSGGDKAHDDVSGANDHEVSTEEVLAPNPDSLLVVGTNTLAIHAFNWNITSSDLSVDAEVIIPGADGSIGVPTPGAENSALADNAAPFMRKVGHSPAAPMSGEDVTITVKANDAHGVQDVLLEYQVVTPGSYIRLTDSTYQTSWTSVPMRDDGSGGDAEAADDIYSAIIPGAVNQHRNLVRYRITSTDTLGLASRAPYLLDPQPNFAYFVYNGIPDWTAAERPGVTGSETFGSDVMNQLPTYHLISNNSDIENSQYNGAFEQTRMLGTIVYDGVVYDHLQYRVRGEFSTYESGKNKWRVFFNRGHEFQAVDDYGVPNKEAWSTVNFSALASPWLAVNRGMAGLDEAVSFATYELGGIPTSNTSYFQLRVIDDAAESTASQYGGDLWGLYITIEHPNDEFIDEHDLPDGNIYKMEGSGDKKNQGSTQPTDNSDLSAFQAAYGSSQSVQWWRENTDLEAFYTFRALNRVLNNADLRNNWNHLWYHRPDTGQWVPIPWDMDMLYPETTHWAATINAVENAVNQHAELRIEFQARARELRDLLFEDQFDQLIDDFVEIVDPSHMDLTMADVDQFMWNYHPRTRGRHIGAFYDSPRTETRLSGPDYSRSLITEDMAGMGQYIKQTVAPTGYNGSRFDAMFADSAIPTRPTITYTGAPGFPLDDLQFQASTFSDPQGAATFGALEWRIGQVTDRDAPAYDPSERPDYEIQTVWESGELTNFSDTAHIPSDQLVAGHAYRARVRMQDDTGRWSHWSAPIEFIATVPENPASPNNLVISEINYNPFPPTASELTINAALDNDDFEFMEVTNISDAAIDLTNVRFAPGSPVDFSFNDGAIQMLAAGERALIVKDFAAFEVRNGTDMSGKIAGEFASGGLSNGGERITLLAADASEIRSFTYDDRLDWPLASDGHGATLVLINPTSNPNHNDPHNWQGSVTAGGNPGGADALQTETVVISEALTHTDPPLVDGIELFNPTGDPIDLSGWFLSDDDSDPTKYVIPLGTLIPPGQYVTFLEDNDADPANPFPPEVFGGSFSLSSTGDEVLLSSGDGTSLTGYSDGFSFNAAANGVSFIRHTDSTGRPHFTAHSGVPTLGSANNPFLVGELVITELHYNPQGANPLVTYADEFIELRNTTGDALALFDAQNPANTWRIDGIGFDFPMDTTLAADAVVLVVPIDPAVFRETYAIEPTIPIFGPYSGSLDNGGERLAVQRPDNEDPVLGAPYIDVDVVSYRDQAPWATEPDGASGNGSSLHRNETTAFGSDPSSWSPLEPTPGVYTDTLTVQSVLINAVEQDPPSLPTGPQPTSWKEQRSELTSLKITFNREVFLAPEQDLRLVNHGLKGDEAIPVTITSSDLEKVGTIVTIKFDAGELVDGVYSLRLLPSVTDASGNALDGDRDGRPGDAFDFVANATNRFYRLAGDFNGDTGVSIFDFPTFAYWFGQTVAAPPEDTGAPDYVDLNADRGVSIFDFPVFAGNFGASIVYSPPGLDAAPSRAEAAPTSADAQPRGILPDIVAPPERSTDVREDLTPAQSDNDAALLDLLAQWNERGMAACIHYSGNDPVSAWRTLEQEIQKQEDTGPFC